MTPLTEFLVFMSMNATMIVMGFVVYDLIKTFREIKEKEGRI